MPKALPQNISALVGEIGESTVLLRLAILAHRHKGWRVFRNVGDSGYDILLSNPKYHKAIRIEVKTRQRLESRTKRPNTAQFDLTRGERNACHFVVAYWLERGEFFIVPKKKLKPISGGRRYRFRVTLKKDGTPGEGSVPFLDNWGQLDKDFA